MQSRGTARLLKIVLFALIVGCSVRLELGERSGSVSEDYEETPLNDSVRKYEHALLVSNSIIDMFRAGDYHRIREEMCDDPMKAVFSEERLAAAGRDIAKHFGAMKGYKPMQWSFAPRTEHGLAILDSSKIVEYERGMVRFMFVFRDDGKYEKLAGLHTRERHGVAEPGQL